LVSFSLFEIFGRCFGSLLLRVIEEEECSVLGTGSGLFSIFGLTGGVLRFLIKDLVRGVGSGFEGGSTFFFAFAGTAVVHVFFFFFDVVIAGNTPVCVIVHSERVTKRVC